MKKLLLTRSRASDYQFVGEQPNGRWWTAFSTVTNFERPSILIDAQSAPTWRAYVTAMQSKRSDRVGTLIRYSLALEGGKDDVAGLYSLVAAWLAPGGGARLAAALDERFPETELERWLEPDGAPDPSDVRGRLDTFFKELEEDVPALDTDGEVVGGKSVRADDVKLFLHAITEISGGEYDVLLVSSSRDVAGLEMDVALRNRSWMAIDRGGEHGEHQQKKNSGFSPETGSPHRSRSASWKNPWVIAGVMALVVIGFLIATRPPPRPSPPPPTRDVGSR